MMIRILILIFVFMCSSFKPVLADPTPSISYLMNEPASLFDLGMYKLEQALNWIYLNNDSELTVVVNYHWVKNRISILFIDHKKRVNRDEVKKM